MTNLTKAIVTVMFGLSLIAHTANAASDESNEAAEQVETDSSGAMETDSSQQVETDSAQPMESSVEPTSPVINEEDPQLGRIGTEDEASDEVSMDAVDSETIRSAQAALGAQGFETKADGIMGPNTQNAIMRFQGENGLPQTGDLDSATLSALGVSESGVTSEDMDMESEMPMDDNSVDDESMDMNEEDTTSP